ncbi:HET domain-containing protein [Fusarium sp. LHS14.1]|nr:HET domain-containing protein [Fusarium sp. LHS14.1]
MDHPPPVKLCQPCKTLLVPEVDVHGNQPSASKRKSYRDQQTLKRSVDYGCFVCSRLWERLDPSDEETAYSYKDSLLSRDKPEDEWSRSAVLFRLSERRLTVGLDILVNPSVFRGLHRSIASEVKILPESTKSPDALSMAKGWISHCVKNHRECDAINMETGWYPTRLLDCGSQTDSDPRCTLVATRTNLITGPYLTLSHCWGLADCIKLTTDNYAEMVRGIPSSQLPQLYQDALCVTRSLGVQYLWIDSLCIIQKGDNLVDWNHEVTLMSQVYSGSLCNISASDAPDATHSLFCTRTANSHFPETIDCRSNETISRYFLEENLFWHTEITESLVNKRAWVLQERLLAPRVLHFGKRHLIWECRDKFVPDASSGNLPSTFASLGMGLKTDFPSVGRAVISYSRTWCNIVRLYANCNLTFPGDRLVALSALARTMGSFMQSEYVAGMWRKSLEVEMLWRINGVTGASRPTTYRAPTWSWVASTGQLAPGNALWAPQVHIKVEKVHLDYATEDTWGTLRGGWLHLRGHLKRLSLDNSEGWKMTGNSVQVQLSTGYSMEIKVWLDAPNDERDKNPEPNWYCMLAQTVRDPRDPRDNKDLVLLLELVDGETGTFKRIGLAEAKVKDAEATLMSPSRGEDEFPCLEYVDGQHLICII